MERRRSDKVPVSSELRDGTSRVSPPPKPNYNSRAVQDALEHLASIDLIELCNEAKIEHCRATRDLSCCGRSVQHVLNSCGHASLCAECSQRCDVCPICRTSISNNGSRLQLRLYYKCIDANLISKRHDDRFQEKEDSGEHIVADIQRLYSLFDVALENNLISLVCHYVSDVCMDESAVSSDPVLAFLLDEVVVKDWCKRTFKKIICELHGIYSLETEAMKTNLSLLQKFTLQLTGISNVLEVLDSSFKDSLSAQLHDLHHLLENTLKAKQHLEAMTWCIRHQFLEDVHSRFPDFDSWNSHVHDRKLAAINRSWPDFPTNLTESSGPQGSTLFIEEALSNLGIEQGYPEEMGEELDISCLRDRETPLLFRTKIDWVNRNRVTGCYPFENLRAAIDILFLHGTSDMLVAKQAIFIYYLFDRHWTRPDVEWRHVVDDFAASFGVGRHSLLESLAFYLLDDHTDQALQEASHLLPEIAGPETHPKIAQVLLERQSSGVALTVLRCTGCDGFCASEHNGLQFISLDEAVTAVRVRVECGLLTEAFMYQRMYCFKVKEEKLKDGSSAAFSKGLKFGCNSWMYPIEVLVTEICYLCIRRNLVDRVIEFPWNSVEEKYLHKCLFDYACQNPSTIHGSLLVVFYLQRYRYVEAYEVDHKLQSIEQKFLKTAYEEVVSRITSISQWRAGLVNKCLEWLPEVQRVQVMTGDITHNDLSSSKDQVPPESGYNEPLNPATILPSSSIKSSLILQTDVNSAPSKTTSADASTNLTSPINNAHMEFSNNRTPSILRGRLLSSLGSPNSRINSLVDGIYSSNPHNGDNSPSNDIMDRAVRRQNGVRQGFRHVGLTVPVSLDAGSQSTSLKGLNPSASTVLSNDYQSLSVKASLGIEAYKSTGHAARVMAEDHHNQINTPQSNSLLKESINGRSSRISGKPYLQDGPRTRVFSDERNMNFPGSFVKKDFPTEDLNVIGGQRWRSDESSEGEEDHVPERFMGNGASFVIQRRRGYPRR